MLLYTLNFADVIDAIKKLLFFCYFYVEKVLQGIHNVMFNVQYQSDPT